MTTDFTHMNTKVWITPSENLIAVWWKETQGNVFDVVCFAARWGADQELEACVQLTRDNDGYDASLGLRATRRPKPPSLKEEALDELTSAERLYPADWSTIRRALEKLDV